MEDTSVTPTVETSNWNYLSQQNYIQQVSIECVIFGYYEKQLKVLIPKIAYKGDFWALPSGFVHQNEGTDEAAERILRERTSLKDIYLEQFRQFGQADRNSKAFMDRLIELNPEFEEDVDQSTGDYNWFTKRFISLGYYALVDIARVIPQKSIIDESITWYDVNQLPPMIMDHNKIISVALKYLRKDLDEKLIAFNLLPDTFTMKELQELYETVLGIPTQRANFQKKILGLNVLERLEKKFTGAANKAPYLYTFKKDLVSVEED